MTIGFIGQGFIGKNYADDFERRGYSVVRYALEEPYKNNKEKIRECDVVFIAVPTPTTPAGFDYSTVERVLSLVGDGKTAVIKSTLLPGTTKMLAQKFPHIAVLCSPEFLAEKTAAHDAANPLRNIVGIPADTPDLNTKATHILSILPKAPFERVVDSSAAELIKYAGNTFLLFKVLYANFFYDLAQHLGVEYDDVREAVGADPRIGASHLRVLDQSGHTGATVGRGAGGHCLIKDFAALRGLYEQLYPQDVAGAALLHALEAKNAALLTTSGKDLDLLHDVYGAV